MHPGKSRHICRNAVSVAALQLSAPRFSFVDAFEAQLSVSGSSFRLFSALAAALVVTACGIPGIRPQGRTQAVTGSAPAGADVVFQRAKQWFPANRYILTDETQNQSLRGYKTIRSDGGVQTRAVIEFTIARINPALTSYHIESLTEAGSPPAMRQADTNAPEAVQAVSSLQSWLSCAAAMWPGCP